LITRSEILKKGLIITGGIIVLTMVQGYWALWDYQHALSSSCMECGFFSDLLYASALPLVATAILHLVYWWLKPGLFKKTIFAVATLMLCWYVIDTIIFDEREASWSTYSNLWSVGVLLCIRQVMAAGLIFGGSYYALQSRKNKDKSV
jgi:hypothetical protein